tara:strand:- start:455 stop:967 length:513 start_codon:yes stop_codon:yes gene_type:complete
MSWRTIIKATNKVYIIDFDDTLFYTPHEEEGKKRYEEVTGEEYPHIGWWSRGESLDMDIHDIPVNESILQKFRECEGDSNCKTVLCTGRTDFKEEIKEGVRKILKENNIHFDEEYFTRGRTLDYKLKIFNKMFEEHPDAEIKIYDDKDDHIPFFQNWAEGKEQVEIIHVK